jgi:hypothetical protein
MFGDEYVQYRKRTINGIPFQGAAVERRIKAIDRQHAEHERRRREEQQ